MDVLETSEGARAAGDLRDVHALYERGLYLQAFREAERSGPLHRQRAVAQRIIAGRLANNLGNRRLGRALHILAWREKPTPLSALYHSYNILERQGPLATLDHLSKWCESPGEETELQAHLLAGRAHAAALLRDFGRARRWIELAEHILPNDAWVLTERSDCLQCEDRYEESLETAKRALEVRPWYRPAVQHCAHLLRLVDRPADAVALLEEASRNSESGAIVAQLAGLHEEDGNFRAARECLGRLLELWPLRDKAAERWLQATHAHLAYRLGEDADAIESALPLEDEYHRGFIERLRNPDFPRRRVLLDVGFVRQHHMTCAPATLSALSRFWKTPVRQLDLAEAICYDGTPAHSERHWAETHGWRVREFTVTLAGAQTLLDRGLPFTLTTPETASSHLQAVTGYDSVRKSLLVRDPFIYSLREFLADETLERYGATGPRGMVLVPENEGARLDGLELADASLRDTLYDLSKALDRHDRPQAEAALLHLQDDAPGHRITLTARRALAAYDANIPEMARVLEEWRALYPRDGNLLLSKLTCMQQLSSRTERIDLLRRVCAHRGVDPAFLLALASELRTEDRNLADAEYWARKALKRNPTNPQALATIAGIIELRGDGIRAVELHRLAACAGDMTESFAQAYFSAARRVRLTEEALLFLQNRRTRLGRKSVRPAMTLFGALHGIDRTSEAFVILSEELEARPDDPELLVFAADAYARFGQLTESEALLRRAENSCRPAEWLRAAARLHSYRGKSSEALTCWKRILEFEALAQDAHTAAAELLSATDSREAAIAHLRSACERFPSHLALQRLLSIWLRDSAAPEHEAAVRRLAELNPGDSWTLRELAGSLSRQGRGPEALEEADRAVAVAPNDPWAYCYRAALRKAQGKTGQAREDCERALRSSVDAGPAIHTLMACCSNLHERKSALAFIEEELRRQVVFGDGLTAFRDAAAGVLDPGDLENALRAAHAARPDLPAAWSVLAGHLMNMGRLEEAWEIVREASERFPLNVQVWLDAALVQRARGDAAGEATALDQALRVEPSHGHATRERSALYARGGDFEAARHVLSQATTLAPLDALNHGWLAEMLWKLQRRDEALSALKRALQLDANYDWAWNALSAWASDLGQPDLPQILARDLLARRPGEAEPWFILARQIDATRSAGEKLAALEKVLAINPRHVAANWSKAQTLAIQGRFDDAVAACSPEAWAGESLPAQLRLCASYIEVRRGNRRRAIAMTRETLADSPAYYDAWQALAGWLWDDGQRDAGAEAAERLGQLAPLSPLPFGYLGSLKLQLGKKNEAKAAFRKALDLDPAYEYAGFRLFDLELEAREFVPATDTLKRLQQHIRGPWPFVCAIRLGRQYAKGADPEDAFRKLASLPGETREALVAGLDALHGSPHFQNIGPVLEAMVKAKETNPAVGYAWSKRRIRLGNGTFPKRPSKFFGREEIAQEAAMARLDALTGKQNARKVRSFLSRHGHWLRRSVESWATGGRALITTIQYGKAISWMTDWRQREGLEPWMLANLIVALRAKGRFGESHEVCKHGLAMPRQDATHLRLRLWFASEEALAGQTKSAEAHLAEVPADALDIHQKLLYGATKSIAAVRNAPPGDRKRIFREERLKLYALSAPGGLSKMQPLYRLAFRRAIKRMSADAGQSWPYWVSRLKCMPWTAIGLVVLGISLCAAVGAGPAVAVIGVVILALRRKN